MSNWSGKSRGGAFGYRFFIFLIKHTCIKGVYFFIRIVAFYFLLFSKKAPINFYFRKIHSYRRLKTIKSIYQNYCLLGEVLVDKIMVLSGMKPRFTYSFEGEEFLQEMSNEGKGGMLIGAHIGNWEMAGHLLDRIDTRVNIVMLEAEHEKITKVLDDVFVNRSFNIIPQKDDYSHLFRISEAFKNNEFVVIHGDRYMPDTNTISTSFLGKPAKFPSGPLYLASKNNVPVTFVYTVKDSATHYHFYATPGKVFPYPSNMKTRKQNITGMVESYVSSLENIVKKYPLQWFNYYHFWEEETIK